MAHDYQLRIRDPRNPELGLADAVIPARYYTALFKRNPVGYENLRTAKHVLENVKRIFSGVRAYNEGGWCYAGRPESWYIREGIVTPFPDNLVFAVYLSPRLRLYEARAEQRSEDDEFSPIDWKDRYGGLVWKHTS